ncbi:MAG: hypothetical protein JSV91_03880, partial [Phycisphaerales bacterium]
IESTTGGDLSWETFVPVEPGAVYLLSGWIRTENLRPNTGVGALFNVHGMANAASEAVVGTSDWTHIEKVLRSGDRDTLHLNCLFGGWGVSTGRAWFDDVKLEKIDIEDLDLMVTIDAGKAGEPISPFVYSQFIEHLGRCIYGGIWAEMIEDRKFFYRIGEGESPWKPTTSGGGLEMSREQPFAGEQTPVLRGGGIAQDGLGLVKGRDYVGYIWLKGDTGAEQVQVSLIWGDAPAQRQTVRINQITTEYVKTSLRFTAGARTDNGRIEMSASRRGEVSIGTISLMPADNINGMRADTIALLKELNAPMYRWPGGNFVSGYEWRDGIGDRDRRPPRKNPAWQGIDSNDFGLDEFITFCQEVNAEPLVVVNTGFGDAYSAAQEVEYANGSSNTPMGALRAANGHEKPYGVKWWGIGNEMYGGWQLGHIPLGQYILKQNDFVRRMRAIGPDIKCIAVGAVGGWSEGMLKGSADHMDVLSEHFYCGEKGDLIEHVAQIPGAVKRIADAHRRYRKTIPELEGRDIRIAIDEWNYWYGPHLYGELGVRYHLKDALGVAAGLHEMFRSTDIVSMAHYAQTVNVIGCIKTTKTDAAFATTGLALKLYRERFGAIPLEVTGNVDLPGLDVAAAFTEDRTALTIAVVNPTAEDREIEVNLSGVKIAREGARWVISHADPTAYNEPGAEPQVKIVQQRVADFAGRLEAPGYGIALYRFDLR